MTALSDYQRLEATGLWRATQDAQRAEVIVSIGDATLVITDARERPLTHWSLPAVERANPGAFPAIYHPDGDPGETLEIAEDEAEMIAAIEKLRTAIDRARPHPGRLRLMVLLAITAVIVGLAVFWLPDQLRRHAVAVVPEVKRIEIGDALLRHMQGVTGAPGADPVAATALTRLSQRLPDAKGPAKLLVMPGGVKTTVSLPGGAILISRALVEDHSDPDILAGYVIAEHMRARHGDALDRLLAHSGVSASVRLLTTGALPDDVLKAYATHLLADKPAPVDDTLLLDGFRNWSVHSTPYAYAQDISGEKTIALIEADPFAGQSPDPVLSDGDWLRLQAICGN